MTRETRILLVIGVLAVLGVTSLALIADRYRRLLTESPRVSASDNRRRPGLPLSPAAPSSEDAVTRFAAVRKEVVRAIRDKAPAIETAVDPATGELAADAPEKLGPVIDHIVERKLTMLTRVGLSGGEYDRIRGAYLAWLGHEDGAEKTLNRSFEARRSLLEGLQLGPLEELDVATSP